MSYELYADEYRKLNPDASDEEIKRGFGQYGFTFTQALGRGVMSGAHNLAGSFGSLGEMIGLPTGGFADEQYAKSQEYGLPPELQGSIVDNPALLKDPRWWAHGVGQVAPSLAATIIPAMGGAKVASMLGAGAKGAQTAGTISGLVPGVGMEMGGFYEETGDPLKTLLYGAGVGATQYLPTSLMLRSILGKGSIGTTLAAGAGEAVQEWSEEPIGALIKGDDVLEAMKQGVNVMPASFIAGMIPGAGRIGFDKGKEQVDRISDKAKQRYYEETRKQYMDVMGMSEEELPAYLRRQADYEPELEPVDYAQKPSSLKEQAGLTDEMVNQDPKFAIAYHGTPHTFDKFSLDAIGTGEGAQAYGWGLYFAGKKEIAEFYRKSLSSKPTKATDSPGFEAWSALNKANGDKAKALIELDKSQKILDDARGFLVEGAYEKQSSDLAEARRRIESGEASADKGNLYQADIPEDNELLDWDKPLSEQPESVREKFETAIKDEFGEAFLNAVKEYDSGNTRALKNAGYNIFDYPGAIGGIYDMLSTERGQRGASEYLNNYGIPGLRYLDANSRGKDEGSHNYVIWDENRVSVEAVNDELKQAAKFSVAQQGEGIKMQARSLLAERFGEKAITDLEKAGVLNIVQSQDELPVQDARRVSGVNIGDKAYLVMENLTPDTLPGVFLHEVGAHYGMRNMLGDSFDGVLKQVDAMLKSGHSAMVEARARVPAETKASDVTEETLAYFLENSANQEMSLFQKILSKIRAFLFKHGFLNAKNLTDKDLQTLAVAALKPKNVPVDSANPKFSIDNTMDGTPEDVSPQPTGTPETEFDKVTQRVEEVGGEQTAFERKRGVIPNEQARALAAALGTTEEHIQHLAQRKIGSIDNVEQLVGNANAIRKTWEESRGLFKDIAEKRKNGTLTPKEIADAGEVLTRMAGMGAQYFGVRGEVGRALQIFKSTQDAVQKAEYMIGSFKGINTEAELLDAIEAMSTVEEPGKAARQARELYKLKASDYFMEWYYMTLLSGVPTHVVNLVSTGIQGAVNEVDNIAAALIGKVLGSEDAISWAEIRARLGAVFKGSRLGVQQFSNVMKNFEGEDYVEYGEQKVDRPQKRAIPGIAGKIIRLPTRFLSAEDAFWKGTFYTMGIAQEAERLARTTGRTVEDLINNPTEDMRKTAWQQAEQNTFTERGGEITKALQRFRKAHPIFNIVFPFVQTPGNILKVAAKHTLAAPLFKEVREDIAAGGRKRDLALARIGVGTSIMGVAVSLALQGAITGQPPEDPNERRLWYQSGKQPYSVKMGDTWVSFSRLEPFGILMGVAADMMDISKRMGADEAEETWSVMIASVFNNLTSKTYLRGLSDLITMIQDPERYSESYFQRFLSTLAVPTGIAYVARANDDRRRMVESIPDAIKSRLPYLRQTLPEKLDIFGQPIMEEGSTVYRMVSPAYLRKVKDDPVAEELIKYDVSFPAIGKKYRGVELEPEDRNELVKMAGEPTYNVLKRVVASKMFQELPDPIKKYTLQRVIDSLRSGARKYWAFKHPEIMREAQQLARERKYGTQ